MRDIAEMYGFKIADIERWGVTYKLKYVEDSLAALFLMRTCLDLQVAQPSSEALRVLNRKYKDPAFVSSLELGPYWNNCMPRISMSFSSFT